MENLLDLLISTDLTPYFLALILVAIFMSWAAAHEPPPGKTPAWIYAILGVAFAFGCGSIFNALITSIQDPTKAGTFLFAVIGVFLLSISVIFARFIGNRRK